MVKEIKLGGKASFQFWILAFFLSIVFLTGGSSRSDVQSLTLLWPMSAIFLALGGLTLTRSDVRRYRALCVFAAISVVLVSLYIIPIPPDLSQAFAAFDLTQNMRESVGINPSANTAALVPLEALSSLYAICTPLAVLILAIQLGRDDLYRLLPVILALSLLSALLAFFQILGDSEGSLYFYEVSNKGRAVGLFANRNHQALLLAMLFPMLAVFASAQMQDKRQAGLQGWMAISAGIFLVPLLLVTGSRAGLVFGVAAAVAGMLIYQIQKNHGNPKGDVFSVGWRIALSSFGIVVLALVSVLLSRAEAITRLADGSSENRADFWAPILQMSEDFLPFGVGPGGLASGYARIEPNQLLDNTYLNRAHNDWLELAVSFGVPGMLLATAAVFAFCVRAVSIFKERGNASRQVLFSKLGMIMVVIVALGSIVDYPLRTPILSAVSVVALVWFARPSGHNGRSIGST